jgi:hypothetical protein
VFQRKKKEVWVHVYSLLDEDALFNGQAVCKQWRNLINQPICWFNRAIKLREEEAEYKHRRAKETGVTFDSDDGEPYIDDEVSFGSGTVAALKRECKMLFIRKAKRQQNYEASDKTVIALLENANAADFDSKPALWRFVKTKKNTMI